MLILQDNELLHIDTSTDYLEHYGVKGMKWGKRLFRFSSPDEKITKARKRIGYLKQEEKEFNKVLKNRKEAKSSRSRKLALSNAIYNSGSLPELAVNAAYGMISPAGSNRLNREIIRRRIRNNEDYIDRMELKKSVNSVKRKYKQDKRNAKSKAERKAIKDNYLNKKYNLEESYWKK